MDKFQKYAELQKTVWPEFKTTTLGNLPAEQFNKIDSAYAEMMAEQNGTPVGSTADSNGKSGQNVEGSGEAKTPSVPTNDNLPSTEGVQSDVQPDVAGQESVDAPSEAVAVADEAEQATPSEMSDTETGFDDEIKAGE